MQQRTGIFFFLLAMTTFLHAQVSMEGRVFSASDSLPLAYVHLGITGKQAGTVSDEQGRFSLTAKNGMAGDTLRFSMLGYESTDWVIPVQRSEDSLFIFLVEKSYLLPRVTFFPEGIDIQMGAWQHGLTNEVWGAGGMASGEELGRYFPLKDGPVRLDTFRFHLRRNHSDSMLFRLNLYTAGPDGWPQAPLLDRDIRFKVVKGKNEADDGWVTVDLADENLIMDGEFVATIELLRNWVGFGYSPIFVSFTRGRERALIRLSSQAPWQKHKRRRPFAFIFEGKK